MPAYPDCAGKEAIKQVSVVVCLTNVGGGLWCPGDINNWTARVRVKCVQRNTASGAAGSSSLRPRVSTLCTGQGSVLYVHVCKCAVLVLFFSAYRKGLLAVVFMVALCNRADHYIFALWFLSVFLLSFFPRLISAVGDWMSAILPHMVWP